MSGGKGEAVAVGKDISNWLLSLSICLSTLCLQSNLDLAEALIYLGRHFIPFYPVVKNEGPQLLSTSSEP